MPDQLAPHEHHGGELHEPVPAGVDPGLYNQDLAPTKREGRTLERLQHLHAVGQRRAQPRQLRVRHRPVRPGAGRAGRSCWRSASAPSLLFVLLNLSGFMGRKTGVPFPVMSRISFGIRGAQIPALVRGGVAIAWFGIQTYLASRGAARAADRHGSRPGSRCEHELDPRPVDPRLDLLRRALDRPGRSSSATAWR